MKYVILVGDGMADYPIPELDGLTPLQKAATPNMDRIATAGAGGLVTTVPEGLPPGSAVANLSIMGYDPKKYFTGRAPLEAASMGVTLAPQELAYRCNLITAEEGKVKDYSGGHITTPEAHELIGLLQANLGTDTVTFHPGVSYRHLLVLDAAGLPVQAFPPHDILGRDLEEHLPTGNGEDLIRGLMTASQQILANADVNKKRVAAGKDPANMIWLWGGGSPVPFPTLPERFGLTGAVISAVDLIKGIGVLAGCRVVNVPGATGYLDTNYKGKAEYALEALKECDLVYIHVEAPDEASHNGNRPDKLRAIEDFDRLVVGTVLEGLPALGDHRVLLLPDHRTPLIRRTHTPEPVPFAMAGTGISADIMGGYSEAEGEKGSLQVAAGHDLMAMLVGS